MSLLMPSKVKFRKMQKGRNRGIARRGTTLSFGAFGIKSLEHGYITSRQLEASRRVILRFLKKSGKMWIRIFPAKPITTKGAEMPMGGGKGAVDHYAFPCQPGRVIFELDGLTEAEAREALTKAAHKLPVAVKFILK